MEHALDLRFHLTHSLCCSLTTVACFSMNDLCSTGCFRTQPFHVLVGRLWLGRQSSIVSCVVWRNILRLHIWNLYPFKGTLDTIVVVTIFGRQSYGTKRYMNSSLTDSIRSVILISFLSSGWYLLQILLMFRRVLRNYFRHYFGLQKFGEHFPTGSGSIVPSSRSIPYTFKLRGLFGLMPNIHSLKV